MKLRKILNWPSKGEVAKIKIGCNELVEMADRKIREHENNEHKRQKEHNGKCPNCSSSAIVNKFTRVKGKGEVHGSFIYGFGDVDGSFDMDTSEVNHCSACGNQWKKCRILTQKRKDVFIGWIFGLERALNDKDGNSIGISGERTMNLLKNIPAESIWKTIKNNTEKPYRKNISLTKLRTKFYSVYGE